LVRYCLAIRIQFNKEAAEFAKHKKSVVEETIKKLEKSGYNFGGTKQ
jgi:hypothetical protein